MIALTALLLASLVASTAWLAYRLIRLQTISTAVAVLPLIFAVMVSALWMYLLVAGNA